MTSAPKNAEEFLKNKDYFRLGALPTEASHPETRDLTHLANNDLPQAIKQLQTVDIAALKKLKTYLPDLAILTVAINETLAAGGRIFLCGCGATGRLSLSLEYLWRQQQPEMSDSVIGFMAGGDVALVHSIEGFEDFTEYGAEHLISLGFSENDLLVSSTEGGETSFVIGATEKATAIAKRKPFFLYCNPRDILVSHVARSRRVLQNPKINSICLEVGPMALSGSTRMQASTVLMLAIGISLLGYGENKLSDFIKFFENTDIKKIAAFTQCEAEIYRQNNRILYSAEDLAITVFTDTTERAPTFSLPPFGNKTQTSEDQSIAYLMIPYAKNVSDSWHKLLARPPRVLEWAKRSPKTTLAYLLGFDFSQQTLQYRQKTIPSAQHFIFSIEHLGSGMRWKLQDLEVHFEVPFAISSCGNLFDHILLKLLLNIHSTMIMARLGRTTSNFMTYVSPTNGKLIDRSARYALWLLQQNSIHSISYEQVVFELFKQLEQLQTGESVVLKTFAALKHS